MAAGARFKIIGDGGPRFIKYFQHDNKGCSYLAGFDKIDPVQLGLSAGRCLGRMDSSLNPVYLRPADTSSPKKRGRFILHSEGEK